MCFWGKCGNRGINLGVISIYLVIEFLRMGEMVDNGGEIYKI